VRGNGLTAHDYVRRVVYIFVSAGYAGAYVVDCMFFPVVVPVYSCDLPAANCPRCGMAMTLGRWHNFLASRGKFRYRVRKISPELGPPCHSPIQPTTKTARARAVAKSANLDSPRCVASKLALFAKSPEVSGSKNTVCLPSPIQI
jgi:hypothetical protein